MHQSTTGEKLTAAFSALAALLILGVAGTAQQSRNVPVSRLAALESDLRFQLNLAHRLNGETLKVRLAEVDGALAAWRGSPQSGADYRLLVEWLDDSIKRSLPGESGELPPTPKFGAAPPPVAAAPPTPPAEVAPPLPAKAPAIAEAPSTAPTTPPVTKPPVVTTPPLVAKSSPTPQSQSPPVQPPTAVEQSVATHDPPPPVPQPAAPQHPQPRPVAPPATPAALASVKVEPVQINLPELNARVAGYHHGLKEIEATLVAARDQLDQERLVDVVGRLEQLANQYQFIRLYYDTLSANERRAVSAPRPLRPTVELVERELAHVERGADGDFLSAFEAPSASEPNPLAARLRAVAKQVAEGAGSSR